MPCSGLCICCWWITTPTGLLPSSSPGCSSWSAVCGLLSLATAFVIETPTLSGAVAGWQALLYAGLVSVGVGYTLQVVGQRGAHPAHAAIILSLETVFAAVGGVLLLGETLDERAIAGCALMLAGMLISQIRLRWWWKSRRDKVPATK
ncbi:EamA family transporter [Aeromonas veronii]